MRHGVRWSRRVVGALVVDSVVGIVHDGYVYDLIDTQGGTTRKGTVTRMRSRAIPWEHKTSLDSRTDSHSLLGFSVLGLSGQLESLPVLWGAL